MLRVYTLRVQLPNNHIRTTMRVWGLGFRVTITKPQVLNYLGTWALRDRAFGYWGLGFTLNPKVRR